MMKKSRWIYMIAALTLFSAHQTHRNDTDKPDYARDPAMVKPVAASPRAMKILSKTRSGKSFNKKAWHPTAAGSQAF